MQCRDVRLMSVVRLTLNLPSVPRLRPTSDSPPHPSSSANEDELKRKLHMNISNAERYTRERKERTRQKCTPRSLKDIQCECKDGHAPSPTPPPHPSSSTLCNIQKNHPRSVHGTTLYPLCPRSRVAINWARQGSPGPSPSCPCPFPCSSPRSSPRASRSRGPAAASSRPTPPG